MYIVRFLVGIIPKEGNMPDIQADYFRLLFLPLLLPFVGGIFILISHWKDDISRYIGLLSLKPVIAYPIWFLISWSDWYSKVYDNTNPVLMAAFPLFPGILLTLIIVFLFKRLFKIDKAVWLFLIGDIVRWMNTFVFSSFTDSDVVFNLFVFLVFFGLAFPSLYTIIALDVVRKRAISQKTILTTEPTHS
jgi:hypothetical protein